MSFAACYKLSSYCLIASGFLAVAMTGALGPIVLMAFGSITIASWFIDTGRFRRMLPVWLLRSIAFAYLPFYYLDFKHLSHSLVMSTLHLMLFIAAMKLLTRNSDRDFLYLYLISFGLLLSAAAVTIDLLFLPCLFLFIASATSSLILFEMRRSSVRAQEGGILQPVVVPRRLRGTGFELFSGFPSKAMIALTVSFTASVIAFAVPLFFLFPRVSLGVSHHPASRPSLISGFSETVELGEIGTIKESDTPVMKVRLDALPSKLPPDLKWRGIALDHFDGRAWSLSVPARSRIPTQGGYFKLQEYAQGTNILVQTFFLEPISTNVVFGSHQVLAVSGDLGWLERDSSDNIYSLSERTSAIRYTAVSDITPLDPTLITSDRSQLPRDIAASCLQVPPEDPRIAGLAHRVTDAADTPYKKAQALESYLRTAYGYSLELKGMPNSADPLAAFLFELRRGHCEYFATAMAIMLRQLDIPSRLVNGFRTGEYNGLSNHWTVRQYNAHSWVEAWFAPYGWVEFDPTPGDPAPKPAFLRMTASLLDALDLWWSDDVVNYDLRNQSLLMRAGGASLQKIRGAARDYARKAASDIDVRLGGLRFSQWIASPKGLIASMTAVFLLILPWLFKRNSHLMCKLRHALARTPFAPDRETVIVSFYAEALDLLKRRGLQRDRSQTPLEFARDLVGEPFGAALASLTAIYNRVRFGRIAEGGDLTRARELVGLLRAFAKK